MRLAFAMLAEAAAVADGKLYVHGGGWNRLIVDKVPAVQPSLAFVFVLELRGDEQRTTMPLTIEVIGAAGTVATVQGAVQPGPETPAPVDGPYMLAHAVTLSQMPLPEAGRYRLRMVTDDGELGSVELTVVTG